MKRFYSDVGTAAVDSGWQVTLDGRGIKTVKGSPQITPTKTLAEVLAAEWAAQGEKIDPASFVYRDMADYAIDVVAADTAAMAGKVVAYGDTDTLLYRADPDEPLYARQQEVWEPVVSAFEAAHSVSFTRVSGIIHKPQSEETLTALRSKLIEQPPFVLAGIEAMTSLAASLIIALNSAETADEAEATALWQAASLEEEWQAELWGRDEEAEERRIKRERDFLASWRFVRASLG